MMIYSDTPIGRKEEDRLNRSSFASQLAKIILGMNADDGLCVSINGVWGSGKTSVIKVCAGCIAGFVICIYIYYNNKLVQQPLANGGIVII